jgi:3-oxoacyl-[acyl-carrier-protein] synthase-3
MPGVRVSGTGSVVPDEVITNAELARRWSIETDDAWITRRTGIRERRFAPAGVSTSDLGLIAAKRAVEDAGVDAASIDTIVFCTLSPDRVFPGCAVDVAVGLGLCDAGRFVPAIDVRNQCSGFVYGLSHAAALIRAGMAKRVLLVGADIHSAALDLSTRGRAVASLFGDGAGAVVLEAQAEPGLRALRLGADGRFADALCQRVWDMRARPFVEVDEAGQGVIPPERLWAQMQGQLVFRHAIERMCEVLLDACAEAGVDVQALDHVFFHQANLRISQAVVERLGVDPARAPSNIERYGNTTSASIPLLLDEAARRGALRRGQTIGIVAFGSGFTWGAAILDW